jgi:hypothetical protein
LHIEALENSQTGAMSVGQKSEYVAQKVGVTGGSGKKTFAGTQHAKSAPFLSAY